MQSGVGKQVLSGMRTNPATTLGYGKRFNYDFVKRAKEQPGAGEYGKEVGACGKQTLSIKKSMPLYSFGSSDRDQAKKIFLSKEHEKGQRGEFSPGPTTAVPVRPSSHSACRVTHRFQGHGGSSVALPGTAAAQHAPCMHVMHRLQRHSGAGLAPVLAWCA
jgi:hypothetical protein